MNRDFYVELINGSKGTINNVNDVAQLVKDEILTTYNVVKVNDFYFSVAEAVGADGYALYVESNDDNNNPFDRKCYVHMIYYLGKVRRGIDKYVAHFLTNYAEYGWDAPMYVWCDGKMVDIDDINNVEENNMVNVSEVKTDNINNMEKIW